ncbi:MAG TPA: hypothetical protein PK055_08820 [Gammaproteobacteria bacterium]|nr:hypothetical protein [Xanthomonadales bacterium]HOP22699.1 hypothetical protein [Gammaproteobacteria bacterium]HPI96269.1 hypothetical protein [Gammaproteobacteria bacterium]HPQ87747.1 hypothetical protein [Gammaproteobacteria bacterium]
MKSMRIHSYISRISKITILSVIFIGSSNAVQVSLNGSEDLHVIGNVTYNYQAPSPAKVGFQAGVPIVCSSVGSSVSQIVFDATDSNDLPIQTANNAVLSTVYNPSQNKVSIHTDGTIKCATETGMHNDVILMTGFEDALNDLEVELQDSNGFVFPEIVSVANQQIFSYRYVVRNNGFVDVTGNFEEFYNLVPSSPYFSGVGGTDWTCDVGVATFGATNCGDVSFGTDLVSLQNAFIASGEELIISVSRIVEIPNGTVGEPIEMLAAAFVKNATDTLPFNNVSYKIIQTTTNIAPTIDFSSMNAFDEDTGSAAVDFTVTDPNMNDADIEVTAISSNPSVIPNSPSNIIISHNGGSDRSIQIVPNPNANTENQSATITIIADDGITTTQQVFGLDINPINDEPSFSFVCIDNVVDSLTGQVTCNDSNVPEAISLDDFITNIDYGNLFESNQKTSEFLISIANDPDGIIHSDIGGHSVTIDPESNRLQFSLVSGHYGTASISVQLRDDGGTTNGGVDLSQLQVFNISVPIPDYQFIATVSGLPTFESFSLRLMSGGQTQGLTPISSNGVYNIGQLTLGSDYAVSIDGATAGATGCTIDDSGDSNPGNGILEGTNLNANVNFTVNCL